jgi:hypothetical protein
MAYGCGVGANNYSPVHGREAGLTKVNNLLTRLNKIIKGVALFIIGG